jgi:hypothetical protein
MKTAANAAGSGVPAVAGLRGERGVTLVEVVVVGVLAVIVMTALTGFYINSQGTWIDSSSLAITQREATLVLGAISDSVHAANSATVNSGSGTIILFDADSPPNEICRFWLNSADSLIHEGKDTFDRGPLATSRVTRFEISGTATGVNIHVLEMRSASGRRVQLSSAASFYNR